MTKASAVALVPARGNSKGLPGKNTRPFAGKPLYQRAIHQSRQAGIAQCIVSTDIQSILDLPAEVGVTVLRRSPELAGDDTPMDAVIADAISRCLNGATTVVLLQPTSPLRSALDISRALALFQTGQFDLVLTATRADSGVLKYGLVEQQQFVPISDEIYCFMNRQHLPPVYRPNGAVYVFDAGWFVRNGSLATQSIGMVEMPESRSPDIDTLADFIEAEAAYKLQDEVLI